VPLVRGPWLLFLLVTVAFTAGGCRRESAPAQRAALPREATADDVVAAETNPAPSGREEVAAALAAVPYLKAYERVPAKPVVLDRDPARSWDGLNLYVSAHAAEAVLIDMSGRVLHRWRCPVRRLWPDLAAHPEIANLDYWRHAQLLPDGRLLAVYEGLGLVELDAASRVLWSYRAGTHHDFEVNGDGTIEVLERQWHVVPRVRSDRPVFEDFLTTLSAGGKPIRRLSLVEAFARSPWAGILDHVPEQRTDIFHTNSVERLDGGPEERDPAFRRGNLLISMREPSMLAVVDPQRQAVVWAKRGAWRRQHQLTMLANGRLLLFDNGGAGKGRSRVIEVDRNDGTIAWEYRGEPDAPLDSKTLGGVQRLPNGNLLITDSHQGRALEVTPQKRVVWEFHNPHRQGAHGEMVAALFEVVRLGAGVKGSPTAARLSSWASSARPAAGGRSSSASPTSSEVE